MSAINNNSSQSLKDQAISAWREEAKRIYEERLKQEKAAKEIREEEEREIMTTTLNIQNAPYPALTSSVDSLDEWQWNYEGMTFVIQKEYSPDYSRSRPKRTLHLVLGQCPKPACRRSLVSIPISGLLDLGRILDSDTPLQKYPTCICDDDDYSLLPPPPPPKPEPELDVENEGEYRKALIKTLVRIAKALEGGNPYDG